MKKRLVKNLLFTLLSVMAINVASAQTWTNDSQTSAGNEVYVGSEYKYRVPVVGTNTYVWSISGGGTLADNGSSGGFDQATVTWTTEGTFTVTVVETTPDLCSTTNTFEVKVIANNSTITFASVDPTCATTDPKTTLSQTLSFTGGKAPWFVDYTITETDGTETDYTNVNVGTSNLFSKEFTNTPGGAAQVYKVTITGARDSYGVKPSNHDFGTDGDITVTLVVNQNPATTTIQHD
ncbi:hypothetical protein [Marinifilum flexuosum]|uniref:PKD domain-containing protein n=1 Tax=Marinifilum flexuosum TaxID=1117708 RepID=A0A419WWV4_9BACT|nr:hypothetical protein [Marinifilum flexuosum]RKD99963.1 hypothetical protein BXY64_2949 [Marinifilum flexuosum]